MVRNYKKKRNQEVNEEDVKNAMDEVICGNMKLRQAAAAFNVKHNTLFYRIKKHKEERISNDIQYTSKYTTSQVFDNDEERMLKEYLLKSSRMNYGLTYKQARVLAHDYATALKKCPVKWTENKEAGIEWLKGFMKRHRQLSLRKPENTSLSRATSFNRHNVTQFYDNYEKVLKKTNFTPDRIYNIDETNIMTVVQAPSIIARKGAKQVGQCVSAERGQLITMCAIVNAIGNALPPVFIFPRARFHDSMLFGAPVGSVGYANSPTSGWMTGTLFLNVLAHLKQLTRCSIECPILLLMDNHESHCTLDAINYCRENGIVVLTFPPHCTHRMQPLDVAVMGPFKRKLAVAQNDWLAEKGGKTISIHHLAGIVKTPYSLAFVAENITAGFAAPGIFPFSRNAFSDEDFECAEVTNRPMPSSSSSHEVTVPGPQNIPELLSATSGIGISGEPEASTLSGNLNVPEDDDMTDFEDAEQEPPSPSMIEATTVALGAPTMEQQLGTRNESSGQEVQSMTPAPAPAISNNILSPEDVRPLPKAAPRIETNKGRKKGKSRILTDTPEKDEVQKAYLERQARLKNSQQKVVKKHIGKVTPKGAKLKPSKRVKTKAVLAFTSSDSDTEIILESEEEPTMTDYEDDDMDDCDGAGFELDFNCVKPGDFLLTQLASDRNNRSLAFVGKVLEKHDHAFTVSFLKKKGRLNKFYFPEREDMSYLTMSDVLARLPPPIDAAGTSRTACMMSFKFNFSKFRLG